MIEQLLNLLPIVSCQEATRLASLRMERRLSLKESFDLKLHLAVCSLCVAFTKQVQGLRSLLRQYQPQKERSLSHKVKDQLKQKLNYSTSQPPPEAA